jgi:hypothetical protein
MPVGIGWTAHGGEFLLSSGQKPARSKKSLT